MSLPVNVIERLFQRLGATYGAAWTRQWADVPVNDVKSAWGLELSGYTNNLEAIAWALENLPERCPNVIEFRNLCRRAPSPQLQALPEPAADPERLRAELAKLAPLRQSIASEAFDSKGWARSIMARHEAGDRIGRVALRFAREALRLDQPVGA